MNPLALRTAQPLGTPTDRADLGEALRTVEVHLYCDHEDEALHGLRQLRKSLAHVPIDHPIHATLEAAVISVRLHHPASAHDMLRLMREHLAH
ncbi:hypothetical protein WNB94_16520 [Aquabacterium sp. A3]|uniref:hypothetical protein n=1 Tax=Aquabacterium sp. A3 TaxID=3132829 RepID=UPI00311A404E